jgi:hypothetical protein
MSDFLLLLRFDATQQNAGKLGENELLHFLHLLRSSAITGKNTDSRAWCKKEINAIILCPVVNDPIGRVEDRYIR